MPALPAAPPIDVERFYALTRDWRDQAELIDGEVVVVPAPSPYHQGVSIRLIVALSRWTDGGPGRGVLLHAPLDVRLGEHALVQPDLAWWREPLDLRAQPSPPCDLAIEILSPASRHRDVHDKRRLYALAGVSELWLVDPDTRAVTALRRPEPAREDYLEGVTADADDQLATALLPGLALAVGSLFPQ